MGWSADEGEGIAVNDKPGFDVGEGTGVIELKMGVVPASVPATGVEPPEGVDACSVANRSGVGEEAELKTPQPSRKNSAAVIQISLFLLMIQFDCFKSKFLAR